METHLTQGLGISKTAERLRHYSWLGRRCVKILAGWFLRIENYEWKYRLAYHLYDTSEHVTWYRDRLSEMRGGNPNANVSPEMRELAEAVLTAPGDEDFLAGYHGVLQTAVAEALEADMERLDPAANANEIRLFKRVLADIREQLAWFHSLGIEWEERPWAVYVRDVLRSMGGLHGEGERGPRPPPPSDARPFVRPDKIVFDKRIQSGPLQSYEERQALEPKEATIEQFKVFFNEFYAAALLASLLYDASEGDYPWEMLADFSRHFWDEARHSEFGCVRLRELGSEPDRVNPVLFEQSQDLPILHRIAYLTRGLEAYFMPRKGKRVKEYEAAGDMRSQLFADQDWSDEINHVRYGNRWTEALLEEDHRDLGDILDEVKAHLSKIRGEPVTDISAPF